MPIPGFEHIEGLSERAVAKQEVFISLLKAGSKESPIKSAYLQQKLGLGGGEIRGLSAYLTELGMEVASRSGTGGGYWWAKTGAEMRLKVAQLKSRRQEISLHINAAERVAARLDCGMPLQERLI